MKYGMEDFWYGMEMEWKKIASMEYGKIFFHSIPYHALLIAVVLAQFHALLRIYVLEFFFGIVPMATFVTCS